MWTLNIEMMNKLICASKITEKKDFNIEDVFITGKSMKKKLFFLQKKSKNMTQGKIFTIAFFKYIFLLISLKCI